MDGFWNDSENASKIQKEKSIIEGVLKLYQELSDLKDELEILIEYADSGDHASAAEALSLYETLKTKYEQAEKQVLLSGEVDANNAILSINAGAGGTESCDWAAMLLRMIVRWSEKKSFKISLMDQQDGDSAGIKSTTLMIEGNYAYGLLKSESGIHRLIRISPFDANKRRHTSFASIFVSPEIDDKIEINVPDNEIKIDVYRSGGAGGQSVNTTDSAVRITHLPTGLVVTCQNERSQVQNKLQAMKVLKSRLYERELEARKKKAQEVEDSKMEIGWGSQIRSYVLHPYKMVKDHRTNFEVSMAEKVLDGDLDGFIEAFLRWNSIDDEEK